MFGAGRSTSRLPIVTILILAVIYFTISRLGFRLFYAENSVVLVWPAAGLALGSLILGGVRLWPAITIATFASAHLQNGNWPFSIMAACATTFGALCGFYLLTRRTDFQPALKRMKDVVWLFIAGALCNALCSGLIGSLGLILSGIIPWQAVPTALWVWSFGDAMGVLMTAPFLLIWGSQPLPTVTRRIILEGSLLFIVMLMVCLLVYGQILPRSITNTLTYGIFPFTILLALRFGQRGVASGMFCGIAIAVWATAHGLGPFVAESVYLSMLQLDVFVFIVCFISMLLAAFLEEHRTLERALRQARDQAENALQARSQFLSNMSHEIRTPMNGIMGMAQILLARKLEEEDKELVEVILSSSSALLAIINDILDLSKIEASKLTLETIRFNLRDCVEDLGDLTREIAVKKGIILAISVDPNIRTTLMGDPGRLRQVLLNLVGNALKFTHQGEVVLKVTYASRSDHDETVHFEVRDTGIGIPEEKIERMFQPFTQVDESTTREYGGTGLGLTISRQLVEAMGGVISVSSQIDSGSTFSFSLCFPCDTEATSPEPLIPDKRVLIFDPVMINLECLEKMLCQTVDKVTMPEEVLAMIETAAGQGAPYQIVFFDQSLTLGPDPISVKIKSNWPAIDLVMLTTSSRNEERDLSHVITARLQKPIKLRRLEDVLVTIATGNHKKSAQQIPENIAPSPETPQAVGHKILLVDDSRVNRKVAGLILKKAGYLFDEATNGLEAVEAVKKERYALIIMDCHMPEMDGFQATRAIRQLEGNGFHTRIIALTARAMAEDRSFCMEVGMDDYLSKPFKADALLKVVNDQIARAS